MRDSFARAALAWSSLPPFEVEGNSEITSRNRHGAQQLGFQKNPGILFITMANPFSARRRERIRHELERRRHLARIPVKLPSGKTVALSPGGQNPLIKTVIEEFCPRFVPGGTIIYIGDAEDKFLHLDTEYLEKLGVVVPAPAKMPDVLVHDTRRNWLLLIEAVTSAGPVDPKRRKELKELFKGCKAGLIFVTAFASRDVMRGFLAHISWETEVWVAEDADHMIHFDGERFLGPYSDVSPQTS